LGETFRKNVIVVGAGASKEYGLPTGAELARSIATIADIRFDDSGARLSSGDGQIVSTLRLLSARKGDGKRDINPFLHAAWRIRDNMSLAPSIDNFLDTHREDQILVDFGKLAICHAIQMAESNSSLQVDHTQRNPTIDFHRIRETWLVQLFKLLVAQRTFDDFLVALSQITFVSFNYDRCIHQFFYFASTSYFALDHDSQSRLLSTLRVLYPYGTIGSFDARNFRTNFGQVIYQETLSEASRQIRTFTEGTESDRIQEIRKEVEGSEILMFLGFGFLPLNMQLLFQDQQFRPIRVLGTGKGLSKDSIAEVELELAGIFVHEPTDSASMDSPDRVRIVNCTCSELFFEFQRYLTRAR
jgi:hypothetical protein